VRYALIAFSFGDDGYLFFNHRIPFNMFFTVPLESHFSFTFAPLFGLRNMILAA
jgi:hypothetical protein